MCQSPPSYRERDDVAAGLLGEYRLMTSRNYWDNMNKFEQIKPGDEIVVKHHRYIIEKVVKITTRTIKTTGGYVFNRRNGSIWGGSDDWGRTYTRIAGDYDKLMTADEAKNRNAAESERIEKAKLARLITNSYRRLMELPLPKLQQAVKLLELDKAGQ